MNDLTGYYSGGAIIVGYEEDKPIACIAIKKISDETCEGKRLFIKPEYRGKGYARIMLKAMTDKTAKSILISCAARLAPFDIPRVREITSYDELNMDRIGEERTILYVIISDMDSTFNFLVSIMYTQLFITLCDKALELYGGALPFAYKHSCLDANRSN